jgi:parallel beta-helix repeat protein
MRKSSSILRRTRWIAFASAVIALIFVTSFVSRDRVSANHPVLVEGNCDSPVPGTTLVAPGTCGDFDGDGRIGTAEDTDGADRIFGTLNAAIGPGTGAAAGTGANHNGTLLIVASGRFAEQLYIGQNVGGPGAGGVNNPGNVTIEAAPGVIADIDAVLQGDPAGGNATRQNGVGIMIFYGSPGSLDPRTVTLRNLIIRNFNVGVSISGIANVTLDNCRIENNLNVGVSLSENSRTVISKSEVTATGRRIGGPSSSPTLAFGVYVGPGAQARIMSSVVSHNQNIGIFNDTGSAASVVLYKTGAFFNGTNLLNAVTNCTDTTTCQ